MLTVGENAFVPGDGFGQASGFRVGDGEIVAGVQSIGVVSPKNMLTIGERVFIQGDGLGKASGRHIGPG